MDAHLFRRFCQELVPWLLGARLEKIHEPSPAHMSLSLYSQGRKRYLFLRFGRKEPFCFLSDERLPGPARPSAAVMRLRKYLLNGRILSVVPQYFSRRLWLMVGGNAPPGKSTWLCLDLSAGASLHFLDESECPLPEEPQWPDRDSLPEALKDWRQWPVLTPQLRKALLPLEEMERLALLADLQDARGDVFLYKDSSDQVVKISPWPLEESGCVESAREEVLEAVEEAGKDLVFRQIFRERERRLLAPLERRIKQLGKLLQKVKGDEARLRSLAEQGEDGRLLADNLWQLPKNSKLPQVVVAAPDGRQVAVALDERLTVGENMRRLFHNAARGKRGLAFLAERRASLEAELAQLQEGQWAPQGQAAPRAAPGKRPVPTSLPRRVQPFWSSDGYLILRGRDSRGNAALRRMASGHDIWVHVEQGPGSHVLVRLPHPGHVPPERVLDEAGTLAANKSWLNEAATASVMYAEARHVRPIKSGPEGKVSIARLMQTRIVPVDKALEERLGADSSEGSGGHVLS